MLTRLVTRPVVRSVCRNITGSSLRWAYRFDTVDDYGVLANRAINVDQTIDIQWLQKDAILGFNATIIAQTNASISSQREFDLRWLSSKLTLIVGGATILQSGDLINTADGTWRVRLEGTVITVWFNGSVVFTNANRPRGAVREPTARTFICTLNTTVTTEYFKGFLYDLRINGTYWPIADRNQSIQLPSPSGLGAELITQSVLENPAVKGTQWTYLGSGRWQYIGDGSYNELVLIAGASQPISGFVEFEVESITGIMRCYSSTSNIGVSQSQPAFVAVGRYRHFALNRTSVAAGSFFNFSRNVPGQAASCIIKNISFKPLGTANPLTLVNTTSAGWEEISA